MDTLIYRLKQRVPVPFLSLDDISGKSFALNQTRLLQVLKEIAEWNPFYSFTVLKKIIQLMDEASYTGKECISHDGESPLINTGGGSGSSIGTVNDANSSADSKAACDEANSNSSAAANGDADFEIEIDEECYELLMEWMSCKQLEPTDTDVIEYTLNNCKSIKLRESPNIISGLGTTGLRTWEAAMFMSNYILEEHLVGDVLELGCGTGMVSISLVLNGYSKDNHVYVTDGDSQLLERVQENFQLNAIAADLANISIQKLWWGEDDIPPTVQTIVAADVTYDASTIPDLVSVINEGMVQGCVETAYIAATKRNEETLAVFEQYLNMGLEDRIWTWSISTIFKATTANENCFYGKVATPVLLYKVVKV